MPKSPLLDHLRPSILSLSHAIESLTDQDVADLQDALNNAVKMALNGEDFHAIDFVLHSVAMEVNKRINKQLII